MQPPPLAGYNSRVKKRVNDVGRRGGAHLFEVEGEQRLDIAAVEVAGMEGESHRRCPCFDRKPQEA